MINDEITSDAVIQKAPPPRLPPLWKVRGAMRPLSGVP